jgi:hypothetical protein
VKNLILCLALCLATLSTASYADSLKAHGGPVTNRVETLPADADNWYVSVMGDPSDPEYQKVVAWFQTNPQLQTLADRTHYSVIPATGAMYRQRYASTVPALPCVRVQTADGTVLCQLSGDNIPATSPAMYQAVKSYCIRRTTPAPQPNIHYHFQVEPKPTPDPVPPPKKPFEDDEPVAEDKPAELPLWPWLVGAGVLSLAIGVGHEWRKSMRK